MGVYVKGMEMSKTCYDCKFRKRNGLELICPILEKSYKIADTQVLFAHEKDCPLIEVSEPHGRLIDADALLMRINHEVMEAYMDGACYGAHPSQEYLYLLGEIIDDAPTVIPAEEDKR